MKCRDCKKYLHAACTLLPAYCLVKYFNSRAQFSCENCVIKAVTNPKYDAQLAWVTALIDRDEDSKPPLDQSLRKNEKEEDSEEEESQEEEEEEEEEAEEEEEEEEEEDEEELKKNKMEDWSVKGKKEKKEGPREKATKKKSSGTPPICRFYLRNIFNGCRTGRAGRDCAFEHPEPCWRFVNYGPTKSNSNGDSKAKGCKLGKDCPRFHPKLCTNALDKEECQNKECRYVHTRNTKRNPPASTKTKAAVNKNQTGGNKYSGASSPAAGNTPQSRGNHSKENDATTNRSAHHQQQQHQQQKQVESHVSPAFLGLQRDISLLQSQMHQIVKMMQMQMNWPPLQGPQTGQWNQQLFQMTQPSLMK